MQSLADGSISAATARRFRNEWYVLLAGLAVVVLVVVYSLWENYRAVDKREQERLTAQLQAIDIHLGRQFNAVNRTLASLLAELPKLKRQAGGMEMLSRSMTAFSNAMPGVRSLTLFDADGNVLASNQAVLLGKNFREREYFQAVLNNPDADALLVGAPYKTALGVFTFNLARRVPGGRGEFAGAIVATLDPEEFKILLGSALYAPDIQMSLVHGSGRIIFTMPENPKMSGENVAQPGSMFSRHWESARTTSVLKGKSIVTGLDRVLAFHTFQPAELKMNQPLVLSAAREVSALFAPWVEDMQAHCALVALLLLISVGGLWQSQQLRRRAGARLKMLEAGQRRSEADLAESERFMTMIVDIIPGMVGYWDKEMRCGFANAAYLEWFGKTPEAMRGIHIQELMGETLFAKNEPYIRAALAGQRQHFERTLQKADGSMGYTWAHYIPDVADGEVRGLFVLISDITEIKLAEQKIIANEAKLQRILNDMPIACYLVDEAGVIYFRNRRFLETFGYTEAEVPSLAEWWLAAYPDAQYREWVLASWGVALRDAQQQGNDILPVEYRVTSKAGEVRDMAISGIVFGTEFLAIFVDQTENRQHEALLNQARLAAESASRAKSEFLANMSHEIRTPMNAIMGMSRLALEGELDPRQEVLLQKVYASAKALLGILNDVLDYSKIEAGRLEMEGVSLYIEDVLDQVSDLYGEQAAQKGLKLFREVAPDVPQPLIGDPLRLGQVLGNLVGNAIKFTERGEIHVRVELAQLEGKNAVIRFFVRDSGIGLRPEQIGCLFQAFSQGDTSITRKFGGTGLGLAISHKLVGLMDGDITVRSVLGQGSTFSFTVRCGLATGETPLRPPRNERRALDANNLRLDGVHILLVEDNAFNQQVAEGFLTRRGARVTLANDGSEAIDWVRRQSFDAVLMDLHMPVLDGFEATRRIRQWLQAQPQARQLPIIAMTAAVLVEDRQRCSEEGMVDFVAKPIDPDELMQTLSRWVVAHSNASVVPAAEPVALPELPGFDLDSALRRLDGDRDSLLRLLRGFAETYTVSRLDTLLQSGESAPEEGASGYTQAGEWLHMIQGVAGNLGAVELARTAARLETQVKAGATLTGRDEFAAVLTQTQAAIVTQLSAAVLGSERGLDHAQLGELLQTLRPYLESRELPPAELVQTLYGLNRAGQGGAMLTRLLAQLDQFDYDGALLAIVSISAEFPLPTDRL